MISYFYLLKYDHPNMSSYHLSPFKDITILLTIFSMLYISSLWYFGGGNWIFVPLNQPHLFHSFSNLPSLLVTSCLFSVSISSNLLCFFNCFLHFTYKWNNMASVFLCLTYSLSIILSRSIHVVSNGMILSFFMAEWYSTV